MWKYEIVWVDDTQVSGQRFVHVEARNLLDAISQFYAEFGHRPIRSITQITF